MDAVLHLTVPSDPGPYDTLYVSPHLDDVALSCPASVLADRKAGRRALVLTLFTSDSADPEQASSTCRDRWTEEACALDGFGADGMLAGLPDAPWRAPSTYRSFNAIVFGRDPADLGVLGRASELIGRLVRLTGATTVVAPLGVGEHIDHRLAHEACRVASADFRAAHLCFYEDRPYSLVTHATRLRLAALGLRGDAPDLAPAGLRELTAAFFFSLFRARYVKSYLHGNINRVAAMARYGNQLQAAVRDGLQAASAEVRAWQPAELSPVRDALASYTSQIPDVVGDVAAWEAASLAWAEKAGSPGAYVERLWSIPAVVPA